MNEEGSGRVSVEIQIPFGSRVFKTEMNGRMKVYQEGTKFLLERLIFSWTHF